MVRARARARVCVCVWGGVVVTHTHRPTPPQPHTHTHTHISVHRWYIGTLPSPHGHYGDESLGNSWVENMQIEEDSVNVKYLSSCYWTITTMTTVGVCGCGGGGRQGVALNRLNEQGRTSQHPPTYPPTHPHTHTPL